jgi:hypothetical protein
MGFKIVKINAFGLVDFLLDRLKGWKGSTFDEILKVNLFVGRFFLDF